MRGDYVPRMTPALRPLVVRLRNWVGDVTLSVPLLQRLQDNGHALQLIGKGWAGELLAGQGWPVHPQPGTLAARVALLMRLRREAQRADPGFDGRLNALCLPFSFSSALDFRLAGLRALGYRHEARGWLLARALARPHGLHELEVYWQLGNALLGRALPPPPAIGLRVLADHQARARRLRHSLGIERGCIVICPFAGGTFAKLDKTWPAFADFVARRLPAFGRSVVICPAPGTEEAVARTLYPSAQALTGIGLGVYAALLKEAAVMISNDTGPGHMAAALGTPLVSVLGPTDAAQWGAWGPGVHTVQGTAAGWPAAETVERAVAGVLAASPTA